MKNRVKLWLPIILATTALTASACGGGGAPSGEPDSGSDSGNGSGEMSGMSGSEMSGMNDSEMSGMSGMEETTEMGEMQGMDMGSMLMDDNGEYSDELFIDNMVPHHQAAIEEAEVALDNTDRPELRELAQNIVSSQESEIAELQQIKEEEFGTSETPMEMSDEEMEMMGMSMTPEELAEAEPFDRAFLDNMTPHHQSAIDMAQVALDNSDNPDIQRIAQEIITAQQSEIEQMQQWREEWYPNS